MASLSRPTPPFRPEPQATLRPRRLHKKQEQQREHVSFVHRLAEAVGLKLVGEVVLNPPGLVDHPFPKFAELLFFVFGELVAGGYPGLNPVDLGLDLPLNRLDLLVGVDHGEVGVLGCHVLPKKTGAFAPPSINRGVEY